MTVLAQVRAAWDSLVRNVNRGLAGGDLRHHVPLVIVMGTVEGSVDGESLRVDCADVAVVVHGSVTGCARFGVPLFVKQGSAQRPGQQGDIPDHLWAIKEFPR